MNVEILGTDATVGPVKDGINGENIHHPEFDDKEKTNLGQRAEEPIQFGSQGASGGKKDGKPMTNGTFLQNATEEWPAQEQIHTFYFVKVRSYEDPKLKAKIDEAEKEVQKRNKARFQITEALKAKRSERAQVISQLKPLTTEDKRYRSIMDEKKKEMEPLQDALGKLRGSNNVTREKGVSLCSSEEELNFLIQSLHYRIQHESNTLSEEKQLLKEIKQLESTREKVIANDVVKAKIQDSLGQKETIQDQVKLIGVGIGGVKKEKQAVRTKIKQLEEELKAIDAVIASLQDQLEPLTEKRDKAFENFSELIKSRQELNTCSRENRSVLNIAKDLASRKDVHALEELCHNEVEKFMSQWSSNKAFRDDYERRILSSLDSRQFTRDGRQRNPDEKPIIVEAPLPPPPSVAQEASIKVSRENENADLGSGTISSRKVRNEDRRKSTEESKQQASVPQEEEYSLGIEKSQEKPVEIDAIKLKEMKREEEIAKANLARERKKKQAEKATARAMLKAQKEEEKKLKEKEKKAKKKAGPASEPSAEETEPETKTEEPEEADVNLNIPVPTKSKELKDRTRYRNKPKIHDQLPRKILKRKKSNSYLLWAVPSAILALVIAVLVYYYQNI
ncbi:Proton pump-interactor protein [Dioscorea alata]|uniref:Proton pump-interactor protein n=1 Tax=Dioscorea alata TaxID=55571 RepID=A0ACB7TUC7_DIOAL|nr:Proton pump-interactor protein [Dioscorea alata]